MKMTTANKMKDVNLGLVYYFKRAGLNWLLLYVIRPTIYLCNLVLRPSESKVCFFVNKATWGDNSAALYDYLLENSQYQINILCSDKSLFRKLKVRLGTNVYYANSFRAARCFLEAYFIVISHSTKIRHFFPYYLCCSQKHVLNLWHGIPLKRLNYQIDGYKTRRNMRQQMRYSSFIVCSETERLMIACCFDMNIDNIPITNTPRNDLLLNNNIVRPSTALTENKKVALYAPTWREEGEQTRLFPFDDFDPVLLDNSLEDLGVVILVRHHIETISNPSWMISSMKNVRVVDQQNYPDTHLLLLSASILITDYSSIYLDYLLLDRPIIYVPYDLKDYERYRGFLIDYDSATAGPKVYTQSSFIDEIRRGLESSSHFADERGRLRERFHRDVDGNACQRIRDFMISIGRSRYVR